ncbi:hypothetical protein NA56DRAFT_649453 [Hyaloscypha hepaticicola]|uniref:Uncharacterized protein n=1 Tax=Hyaloscypha hepaticicola TaxID=2082293 RepID=A0A2J6PQI1_9HELO|nr:hypothetical protein NA56DRAFT_649453 [Hyaloscypha hepaticicola]
MDPSKNTSLKPGSAIAAAQWDPLTRPSNDDNTKERIKNLGEVQNPNLKVWYDPGGTDKCYYAMALNAAKAADERFGARKGHLSIMMKELKHSPELDFDPVTIKSFLEKLVAELKTDEPVIKRRWIVRRLMVATKEAVSGLKTFVLRLIDVAQAMDPLISLLLPSSPEYAIPYACLKVLFVCFQAIAKDKMVIIKENLDVLETILKRVSFETATDPTEAMKILVARIYVSVLDFLERLVEFSRATAAVKVLVALKVMGGKDYNFEQDLKAMGKLVDDLKTLGEMSLGAKQHEAFLLVRSFAAVMPIVYNVAMDTNQATQLLLRAQAISSTQSILDSFLMPREDVYDELELWRGVCLRVSPGDRWERNGILAQMELWGKSDDPIFFCVGPFGSKHSWVTSFSLDLITMLQSANVTLTFALCDRPRDYKNTGVSAWSPTMLVKRLLGQLLEQEPMLVFQQPELFTARNFARAKHFPAAWRLLERVVETLDRTVIIIDRIDACTGLDDEKVSLGGDFLKRLATLARKHQQKVRIVITSAEKPPLELCEALKLRYAYINTQKSPHVREWAQDDQSEVESDDYSETDDRSDDEGYRSQTGIRTVQRYRVTPSRVEPVEPEVTVYEMKATREQRFLTGETKPLEINRERLRR